MRDSHPMGIESRDVGAVSGDHIRQSRQPTNSPGEEAVGKNEVRMGNVVSFAGQQSLDDGEGGGDVRERFGRRADVLDSSPAGDAVHLHPTDVFVGRVVLEAHGDEVHLVTLRHELAAEPRHDGSSATPDRGKLV